MDKSVYKLIALVALIALGSTTAYAGLYSRIGNMAKDERKVESTYTLEVIGENPSVYEFTPKHAPDVLCVFLKVQGTQKSPVMQCFKK